MTKEQYLRWSAPYRGSRRKQWILNAADKLVTVSVFFSYPFFLFYIAFCKGGRELFWNIAIPGVSFCVVSLFRKLYSAPRPYEIWGIAPLLYKDTKGKSFPSRHAFSVFVIGMVYFYDKTALGAVVFFAGAVLSFVRVIGGVHFVKDVLAGAAFGVFAGMWFWVLGV
jgi:membrane-associated phospholipid phosphatase